MKVGAFENAIIDMKIQTNIRDKSKLCSTGCLPPRLTGVIVDDYTVHMHKCDTQLIQWQMTKCKKSTNTKS